MEAWCRSQSVPSRAVPPGFGNGPSRRGLAARRPVSSRDGNCGHQSIPSGRARRCALYRRQGDRDQQWSSGRHCCALPITSAAVRPLRGASRRVRRAALGRGRRGNGHEPGPHWARGRHGRRGRSLRRLERGEPGRDSPVVLPDRASGARVCRRMATATAPEGCRFPAARSLRANSARASGRATRVTMAWRTAGARMAGLTTAPAMGAWHGGTRGIGPSFP